MRNLQQVVGGHGLYDHNMTIVKAVGENVKVVRLRSIRKKGLEDTRKRLEKTEEEKQGYAKLEAATSRAKRMVKEYALCNDWDWFVTFTIDKSKFDRYNLKAYYKALGEFLHNYNRRCNADEKVRYLLIPEMHKDGAWHMHGLIKGIRSKDLVLNQNGYYSWNQYASKFGFMSLGAIRDKQKVSSYITKYITKALAGTVKEYGANLYYCSKGLSVGEELYRGNEVCVLSAWDYIRPDGFCRVKWFDSYDSYASNVLFTQDLELLGEVENAGAFRTQINA